MPSATRAEALVAIPEVIDGATPLGTSIAVPLTGAAIVARRETAARFPPLGPPDILYTRKRYVPVVGTPKIYGYYHFVRGVDTSHAATVSAYIVDVVCNKGLDPLPWVNTGAWEISSATFVTYNLISKADLHVHVDFPGSTTATAYDSSGRDVPLDDTFWYETIVSTFVRDIASVGELPLYPCLRVLPISTHAEPRFLDAAIRCVHRWHLAGNDDRYPGEKIASRSRIALAIRAHFLNHSRFEAAISFFRTESLLAHDPQILAHAAVAARASGDLELATSIIKEVIADRPNSDLAWAERAKIFRANGQLDEAADAARSATANAGESVDAWVTLADICVDLKQYSKAFEALNSANMPPPTLDPFLRELVPNRKNLTAPVDGSSRATDAVRVLAQRLREEKNISNAKTDETLSELPGKLMLESEQDCYAVLVKILNDLSWDEMLSVRGECFVMETDVENGHILLSDDEEGADLSLSESGDDSLEDGDDASDDAGDLTRDGVTNGIAAVSLSENTDTTNGGSSSAQDSPNPEMPETVKRSLEKIGKKVCKPWLDYLVTNMYKDLRAMAVWHGEEQQHSSTAAVATAAVINMSQGDGEGSTSSATTAPHDIEAGDSDRVHRRTSAEIASKSKRPPADWMRRGELALRLGKHEEAKTAFWACVILSEKAKQFAVTSLCRLLNLAADEGDMKISLKCADSIWSYLDANVNGKDSLEPTSPVSAVRKAIFTLISKKGLRPLREVVTSKVEVDRKRMDGLLLDSVAWKVDGFSR